MLPLHILNSAGQMLQLLNGMAVKCHVLCCWSHEMQTCQRIAVWRSIFASNVADGLAA